MIRAIQPSDISAVTSIYNHYIGNTVITFEEEPLSPEEISQRVEKVTSDYPWIVCEENGIVVGYSYASRFRERAAYRYTVETTVYIDKDHVGKGSGLSLYRELVGRLKASEFKVALGGIALPNPASVGLHEKLGFKKVAHLTDVGFKFEQWVDVGYWELQLRK